MFKLKGNKKVYKISYLSICIYLYIYLKVEELNGQIKKQETTESRTIRSIEPEPQAPKSYPGRKDGLFERFTVNYDE